MGETAVIKHNVLSTSAGSAESALGAGSMGANLLALKNAPKDSSGVPNLQPGFLRKTVSSGGIINYIYNIIYQAAEYFSPGVTKRHVLETLLKTREAYRQKIKEVEKAYDCVDNYLSSLSDGKDVDKVEIAGSITVVLDYLSAIASDDGASFKKLVAKANEAYDNVIKDARNEPWFQEVMGTQARDSWLPFGNSAFPYDDRISRVQRRRDLLDLIECMGSPIPVSALRKLSLTEKQRKDRDVKITSEESKRLNTWITEVNGSWRMDVHRLHRGLRGLFEHLDIPTICSEGEVSRFAQLLSGLVIRGMTLLTKEDRKHVKWRSDLRPMDVLQIGDRQYPLEKQLGPHRSSSSKDKHLIYTVKDSDGIVISIPMNEAAISLSQAAESKVVPRAQLLRMDRYGRFAIYERLKTPLDGHTWHSGEGPLDGRDRKTLNPIVNLLKSLVDSKENPKTPQIAAKEFMLDSSGNLKLLRGFKQGDHYDYDLLVRFCRDTANGSLTVFKHLLTDGGLAAHPLRQFYKAVVEDIQRAPQQQRGVDKVATAHSISDPQVREQAKALREDVLNACGRCRDHYIEWYDIDAGQPISAIEAMAQQAIVTGYDDSIGAGILWPKIEENAVIRVADFGKKKLKPARVEKIWSRIVDDKPALTGGDVAAWKRHGVVNDDQRNALVVRLNAP